MTDVGGRVMGGLVLLHKCLILLERTTQTPLMLAWATTLHP